MKNMEQHCTPSKATILYKRDTIVVSYPSIPPSSCQKNLTLGSEVEKKMVLCYHILEKGKIKGNIQACHMANSHNSPIQ